VRKGGPGAWALSEELIGQTIGGYQILRTIGRGGMGVVYEGQRVADGHPVAIKVPRQELRGNPEYLERFLHEARTAARLRHPRIVATYEVAAEGDFPFIVMEYVRGRTLAMAIRKAYKFDADQALDIVHQVANAVAFIHANDTLHRDIKPANILLDDEGRAKLMDFGVARGQSRLEEGAIADEAWIGTAAYQSPEQLDGRNVDLRADVYALGVVLFEMLAGRVPYEAQEKESLKREILTCPPPLERLANPTVPPLLTEVLDCALAKNPDDRYSSAGEFLADLEEVMRQMGLKPQRIREEPPPPIEPSAEPASETPGSRPGAIGNLIRGLFRGSA